jgi:tetratricopeptide (TPR) repeat protein
MKYLVPLFLVLCIIACDQEQTTTAQNVTNPADYTSYLEYDPSKQIEQLKQEIDSIDNLVAGDTTRIGGYARMASRLDQLFDLTGDPEYLEKAARFRESVTNNTAIRPQNSRLSVAHTYIKQHRFKDADSLMNVYYENSNSRDAQLVQFDIAMELGEYDRAEALLDSVRNTGNYNYLIRAAKWNDYKGQLDTTVELMEEAAQLAEQSGQPSMQVWSYSNIADYYGHHGQIEKSYENYLKTLEVDPQNTYALKGIAWIAYSHDDDPQEAIDILTALQKRHPLPDYQLELAELYEYQGKEEQAAEARSKFMAMVQNPAYRDMYNTYMITELADQGKTEQAVELARREVNNRATPETYDLLGYALLKDGQPEAALRNHQEHVVNKTYEPVAQLHTAMIYKANDMQDKSNQLKEELLETRYEMGPATYSEIEEL